MTVAHDKDVHAGLEAVQADMAEHQRRFKGEVTGEANRKLATETFQQLENQGAFAAPASDTPNPPYESEVRTGERDVDGRKYTLTKEPDKPGPLVPLTNREQDLVIKALKRLHMLLTLQDEGILGAPSWSDRAKAVMAVGHDTLRFARELDELLEASNRYFGDYKVDPDKKVMVG